jgi:hypothetical protein
MSPPLDDFVALSAALTGYRAAELLGTGMAEPYLDRITAIVGEPLASRLWTVGRDVVQRAGGDDLDAQLELRILDDPDLGPPSRNVIVLWYTGQWLQLPGPWRDRHGAGPLDVDHIISPDAYVAGLMWDAIGAHPQGAKAPGFATWVGRPTVSHG